MAWDEETEKEYGSEDGSEKGCVWGLGGAGCGRLGASVLLSGIARWLVGLVLLSGSARLCVARCGRLVASVLVSGCARLREAGCG